MKILTIALLCPLIMQGMQDYASIAAITKNLKSVLLDDNPNRREVASWSHRRIFRVALEDENSELYFDQLLFMAMPYTVDFPENDQIKQEAFDWLQKAIEEDACGECICAELAKFSPKTLKKTRLENLVKIRKDMAE